MARGATPKAEKPALKMLGNEGVPGADQVQHLDHGAVGCNRPAGREGDREHGRNQDKRQHREPAQERRPPHRAHVLDKAAMVVDGGTRNLLRQSPAELAKIGRGTGGDAHHGKARHWQLLQHQAGAKPRLQQARGFLLGIDPDIGHAW